MKDPKHSFGYLGPGPDASSCVVVTNSHLEEEAQVQVRSNGNPVSPPQLLGPKASIKYRATRDNNDQVRIEVVSSHHSILVDLVPSSCSSCLEPQCYLA